MEPLDLGHDHTLRFTSWSPDRALNPQYDGIPDVKRYGAIIRHRPGPHPIIPVDNEYFSGWCEGGVTFDGEVQRQISPNHPRWAVESWEPLTISPSVLCSCGDHGFVRNGQWVPA